MVGIKSKLPRSVFVLFLFYGTAALILFLSMSPDELGDWLEAQGRPATVHIDPINMPGLQIQEITLRFNQVWPWFVGGVASALVAVWLFFAAMGSKIQSMG